MKIFSRIITAFKKLGKINNVFNAQCCIIISTAINIDWQFILSVAACQQKQILRSDSAGIGLFDTLLDLLMYSCALYMRQNFLLLSRSFFEIAQQRFKKYLKN